MSRVVAAVLVALAVGCGTPAPEPVPEPVSDDPVLLLGDVQHLLGEAVAYQAADDRAGAERSWAAAVRLWTDELAPRVRAHDAARALQVEYALGRLGDALRRPGSRAATLHKPLDRALRELEPLVAAPVTPPAPPDDAAGDAPP